MSKLLTPDEIAHGLTQTAGWTLRDGSEIARVFTLPSFPAALVFAAAVGHLAERMGHHPDILIQYRKVTLSLSTHDAGGLTALDFDLARAINALVE